MTLIDRASKAGHQAEVYRIRRKAVHVRLHEGELSLVAHRDRSACALRVIHDGRLGASFAESPSQDGLLEDASAAARFGQGVSFAFASALSLAASDAGFNPKTADLTAGDLIDVAVGVRDRITASVPGAAVNLVCEAASGERSVETTEGAAAEEAFSRVTLGVEVPFAAGGGGAAGRRISVGPEEVPDAWLEELIERSSWGAAPSVPSTGRLPVLLSPYASSLLTQTLAACLGSGSVSKGASPLAEKVGQQILSERLTMREDPTHAGHPYARAFDDEGVAVKPRTVIENGVLQGFLTDLAGAEDLGTSSTGNALRRTMFSQKIEDAPVPNWLGAIIEPGEQPWRDLMAGIEEGILVTRTAGLHSCNLLQGQYAVQASGFHIRDGQPIGYLERVMLAGNVFEDFRAVRAVSREQEVTADAEMEVAGLAPYILLDSAQVTVG